MDLILFLLFGMIAVVSAFNVVLQRHPISSALSLVGVMGSLALIYLQLGGVFIAAAQIIVYAGAVMVLFIFVIMLLNAGAESRRGRSFMASVLGGPLLVGLFLLVGYFVEHWYPESPLVKFGAFDGGTPLAIGRALFTTYLLPFEITSLLVLIAIVGAVVLARKEMD
jgi:NADH-quinone oxidoreductase subunit J